MKTLSKRDTYRCLEQMMIRETLWEAKRARQRADRAQAFFRRLSELDEFVKALPDKPEVGMLALDKQRAIIRRPLRFDFSGKIIFKLWRPAQAAAISEIFLEDLRSKLDRALSTKMLRVIQLQAEQTGWVVDPQPLESWEITVHVR